MKKILLALSALSMSLMLPSTPAVAQSGAIRCEARSPFAVGLGFGYTRPSACNRALYECSIRTPMGYSCYVSRWWFI